MAGLTQAQVEQPLPQPQLQMPSSLAYGQDPAHSLFMHQAPAGQVHLAQLQHQQHGQPQHPQLAQQLQQQGQYPDPEGSNAMAALGAQQAFASNAAGHPGAPPASGGYSGAWGWAPALLERCCHLGGCNWCTEGHGAPQPCLTGTPGPSRMPSLTAWPTTCSAPADAPMDGQGAGQPASAEPQEPKKSTRGRKKRTEPVKVLMDNGDVALLSPKDYRSHRRSTPRRWWHERAMPAPARCGCVQAQRRVPVGCRRITNRESARRMRKKRAEERTLTSKEVRPSPTRHLKATICAHDVSIPRRVQHGSAAGRSGAAMATAGPPPQQTQLPAHGGHGGDSWRRHRRCRN